MQEYRVEPDGTCASTKSGHTVGANVSKIREIDTLKKERGFEKNWEHETLG